MLKSYLLTIIILALFLFFSFFAKKALIKKMLKDIPLEKKLTIETSLTTPSLCYRPFRHPWAIENWEKQQSFFWLPEEISFDNDKRDFAKLSPQEKNLLVQILRFFTQTDISVADIYVEKYLPYFKSIEIRMMLLSFANMETIHVHAYQMLITTLGMPETEFSVFMEYKEMKDKYDYMQSFDTKVPEDVAANLGIVSGFIEGTVLFASFVILLYFSKKRPNEYLMLGLGNVIEFSMRDETLHALSIIQLYKAYVEEAAKKDPNFNMKAVEQKIYNNIDIIMGHEMKFIDLCFGMGDLPGLSANEVKEYIMFICNRRCEQLGLKPYYPDIKENPLPWVDTALGLTITNFFNGTPAEYEKSRSITGWDNIF